jgi:putative membrane protein
LTTAAVVLVAVLVWTCLQTGDRLTWLLEVFPVLIALPLLAATQRRYPLTTLLYVAIFWHAVVLMVGGQYTYAKAPLGFWMQDWWGLQRNPYDKIGHFMQGFVPALAAREILLRGAYIRGPKMLAFLALCVVLAISATYELIEWAAAVLLGQGADEFLGTQGDPWDTQSDMAFAGLGAMVALALFSRMQDRQIRRLRADGLAAAEPDASQP